MCKADEAEQGKEAVGDAVRKAVWQDCPWSCFVNTFVRLKTLIKYCSRNCSESDDDSNETDQADEDDEAFWRAEEIFKDHSFYQICYIVL